MTIVDGPVTRTDNDFLLGFNQGGIRPMAPVHLTTRQQAYRTAAWILAMADLLPEETLASRFDDVRAAIEAS